MSQIKNAEYESFLNYLGDTCKLEDGRSNMGKLFDKYNEQVSLAKHEISRYTDNDRRWYTIKDMIDGPVDKRHVIMIRDELYDFRCSAEDLYKQIEIESVMSKIDKCLLITYFAEDNAGAGRV